MRLVIIALHALSACTQAPKSESAVPSAVAQSAANPSTAKLDAELRGWEHAKQYTYHLEMASRLNLGEGSAPLVDFVLTGTAELAVVSRDTHQASVSLTIRDAKLDSHVPGSEAKFSEAAKRLSDPYMFTLSGGLVTESFFSSDTPPLTAGIFRATSAALQFARTDPPSSHYQAEEFDTSGQYLAEYSNETDSGDWLKVKRRYLQVLKSDGNSTQGLDFKPTIKNSRTEIRLSSKGHPTRVNLTEDIELTGAQTPFRGSSRILLTAEGEPAANVALTDGRNTMTRVAASDAVESRVSATAMDDAKINGQTFDELLRFFEAQERQSAKSGLPTKDQSDASARSFAALSAILRRHPETVNQATKSISAHSAATDVLLDGLGSADTAEAQNALISLAKDNLANALLRSRAIISLSRVEHPTKESIQALISLLDDRRYGTQALYGLGTFCRIAREAGDRLGAKALGDVLVSRLGQAKSAKPISEALRAIANSGYVPALTEVKHFVGDSREQVRIDALRSMSLMNLAEVDNLLSTALLQDESVHVRLAAIESSFERPASDIMVEALRRSLASTSAHIRYQAVQLMIKWLPKRPDLRADLEQVSKTDQEQKLRELAGGAV